MLRVLIVIVGIGKPSARLRMLPLAAPLRARGHKVTIIDVPQTPWGRFNLLRQAGTHDVVLLQKKLFSKFFVKLLCHTNSNLIFDADDAVMFHEIERGQQVTGKYFGRFSAIASASHMVVAGNQYIAEYSRAARLNENEEGTMVLPTPIDINGLLAKQWYSSSMNVTVGWIGTKGNLPQLVKMAPVFKAVQKENPFLQLKVVADEFPELPGVSFEKKVWRAQDELADLHGFDIGIMPLCDNLWNRGKGGYKLLQYMAAGLPAIASPVGINSEIIQHGTNGFLANSSMDWHELLLKLIRQHDLRQQMGREARKTIENSYSLGKYLDSYVTLIENCIR